MFHKPGKQPMTRSRNQPFLQKKRTYGVDFTPAAFARPSQTKRRGNVSDAAQARQERIHSIQFKVDLPFLLSFIALLLLGLVALSTASYDYSYEWYGNPYTMLTRQVLFLGIGLVGMIALAFFDYHWFRYLAFPGWIVTVAMLVLVLVLDQITNNAVRSILGGSIRPSELAKLIIVLYVSIWSVNQKERLTNLYLGLIPLGAVLGVTGALIFGQPDISAVITVFSLGAFVYFLAGGSLKHIGYMMGVALAFGVLVVRISATASKRISEFVAGVLDPSAVSDHVRGGLEGFVAGGFWGVGLGRGSVKMVDLPVAPTDSIFAVIGEEFGMAGAMLVVILFTIFLWRGLKIAAKAPDALGSLFVGGLSLWIALEAFVNMAVMLNILPFAGNALPFFSAGGSHLVTTLAAVGIILNVSRQTRQQEEGVRTGAPVDMRRSDRGRSVSRPHDVAGSHYED